MSEDKNLIKKGIFFKGRIENCKIEYIKRGEHKIYENGKKSILRSKNSILYIKYKDNNIDKFVDYNKIIVEMIKVYEKLKEYFDKIKCEPFINLTFFDKQENYFSLEFSEEVLALLSKYHFSLPISCYRNE
jgi:hypothetical protein